MSFYSLLLIVSYVIVVFIGVTVFYRDPRAMLNRSFLGYMAIVSIWIIIKFGLSISYTFEQACFWWRLHAIAPLISVSFVYFVLCFIERENLFRSPLFNIVVAGSGIFFVVGCAIYPDRFISLPEKVTWGWYYRITKEQDLFWLYATWAFCLGVPCFVGIIRYYYANADQSKRRMTRLFFAAVIVGETEGFLTVIKSITGDEFPSVFAFSALICVSLTGYAIWKYQMFGLTPTTTAQSIVTTMTDGLLLVNKARAIAWYNRSACEMMGYNNKELIGAQLSTVFRDDADSTIWLFPEQLREKPLQQVRYWDTWLRTKTDRSIPVSLAGSLLFDMDSRLNGFVIIIRDITERIEKEKELESYREGLEQLVEQRTRELQESNQNLQLSREQLRFLGERLVNAKENESARIARELHDELGQLLTSMKIDLTLLNRHLKKSNADVFDLAVRCDELLDINGTAIRAVQQITGGLRPPVLDDIGLSAALTSMVAEFERRTQIQCSFKDGIGYERYDSGFSIAVYRIVQESLTNVMRHADADRVSIEINEKQGVLHVLVVDNGKGIADGKINGFHSFGVLGMMERARSFGGELKVCRAENNGTEVALNIPILKS